MANSPAAADNPGCWCISVKTGQGKTECDRISIKTKQAKPATHHTCPWSCPLQCRQKTFPVASSMAVLRSPPSSCTAALSMESSAVARPRRMSRTQAAICSHKVRAAHVKFGQRKGGTKKNLAISTLAESVLGPAPPPLQARQPTPHGRPTKPPSIEFVLGRGPVAARQGTESN